jgi:hypothetical protein
LARQGEQGHTEQIRMQLLQPLLGAPLQMGP